MAKTIMIIEDEPDIRDYLMAALEDSGFRACTVEAQANVTEAVHKVMPDLIVLDVMMPKRSGISIYKELRNCLRLSKIPVAMLSGITVRTEFMDNGFRKLVADDTIAPPEGFVEKPVDLSAFLELVGDLTAQSK